MNAKDYRIGNYLHDTLTGAILIVDEIPKGEKDSNVLGLLVVDRSKYPLPPGWQAAPIPITTKMLERCCEFNTLPSGPYSDQPAVSIGKDATELIWSAGTIFKRNSLIDSSTGKFTEQGFKIIGKADFIHQLQNAWPFLKECELKIKI